MNLWLRFRTELSASAHVKQEFTARHRSLAVRLACLRTMERLAFAMKEDKVRMQQHSSRMRLQDVSTAVVTPRLQFDELAVTIAMVLASNGGACCTVSPEEAARALLDAVESGGSATPSRRRSRGERDDLQDPTPSKGTGEDVHSRVSAPSTPEAATAGKAAAGKVRPGLHVSIAEPASAEPTRALSHAGASISGSGSGSGPAHWLELQKMEGRSPISLNEQLELLFQWQSLMSNPLSVRLFVMGDGLRAAVSIL